MDILDTRFVIIKQCNGGYVVMCHLHTRKIRDKFNGASVAILSPRSGWIPYRNSELDECTQKTEKLAKHLLFYRINPFELGGAL